MLWLDTDPPAPDYRAAFRGSFELATESEVEIHALGASWFRLSLDGAYLADGPARFEPGHPEEDVHTVRLGPGEHLLAAQVIYEGVETKRMPIMPPFLSCRVLVGDTEASLRWKCRRLEGQQGQLRRINGDCGWIDWQDTRRDPAGWDQIEFDEMGWHDPIPVAVKLAAPGKPRLGPVRSFIHTLTPTASGLLAETFGYDQNDPPVRFFLRDLAPRALPPSGVWQRYDLGRVRLGCPRFTLDLPPGAVVELGYSEQLRSERVAPWITLSSGASCNLDHFVARGGVQEFFPLTPKGGRFLEVHILAPPTQVRFVREEFVERGYYGEPEGAFACDDAALNRIWNACLETFRACAEDAITDNPTRERGQWTGDAAVALETASVAYADLRPIRRMLFQAAQSARADGMVSCLSPANAQVVSTYAAQWVSACVRYHELTGDKSVLEGLFAEAVHNMAAFERFWGSDGLTDDAGWGFVDWGYARPEGTSDPALNLHYLSALRDMGTWCLRLGRVAEAEIYVQQERRTSSLLRAWLDARLAGPSPDWNAVGYHVAALALAAGLLKPDQEPPAVVFLQQHLESGFPNAPDAPRLSDPDVRDRGLITPYFAHYAFPLLIQRGAMDFVQEQYRRCWGWMLSEGRTTCLEVFDTRWSHCHQWSACPAWQLSRSVLGLHPRFDRGVNQFVLNLCPGSLLWAKGRLPLQDGGQVSIHWTRENNGDLHYHLETPEPVWVQLAPDTEALKITTLAEFGWTRLEVSKNDFSHPHLTPL